MIDATLAKITSRGYWKVVMRPSVFKEDRIATLEECEKLVADCKVSLRGWDYPHHREIRSGRDYIWSQTDWEDIKEFWRFYQTGQFVNYFGCEEDWWQESRLASPMARRYRPGEALEIICTLFRLTEMYEFASRLAQKGVFDRQMNMMVELRGMRGRRLIALDRLLFSQDYVCDENNLSFEKSFLIQELVGTTRNLSLEHSLWVFERFNWRHVRSPQTIANLRQDQEKLLERRL